MKQKILIWIFLIAGTLFSTSCIFIDSSVKGNGKVVEEKRKAGKFDAIKVSRGMNVYISQGNENRILVKADENLLEFIETDIDNNTLKISTSQGIRKASSKKVFVTVREIKSIRSLAGSNVFSETQLNAKDLALSGSAGSNIKVDVNAENLDVSASAGSNVKISGNANSFVGKASAGSNIKAEDLKTTDCDVKTSSGANIWIHVSDELLANANSGGNIFYFGNPEHIDVSSSSGGNIIKNK